MNAYYAPLHKLFLQHANKANADAMKAYLKNQFDFFGIKTDQRRACCKQFLEQYGLPDLKQLEDIVLDLYNQQQREFHYFAIELLLKLKKQWTVKTLKLFEKLILKNSWWDTVDLIAVHAISHLYLLFKDETLAYISKWNKSENIWLIRTSIIFQNNLKAKTDTGILLSNIKNHTGSNEFFIQKAIGWALRQYAYTDAAPVIKFCKSNKLKPLSYREAMKHLN